MSEIYKKNIPKSALEEEVVRLKKEKLFRLQEEPWRYYVPTGKAEEFIQKVGSGEYFISLFSAANGIGKTCVSINMLLNLFWPDLRTKWFKTPLWEKWSYVKKARIVSDPTLITSSLIPEIEKWFPKGRYKTDKCGKNYKYKWTTDTGWEFTIMSFDQDPKEFEGVTLGAVWLDEPCPEAIYKANISRLRKGGILWISATPLTGSSWMYDSIIANKENDKGKRCFVQADVESACKIHGVRGHLEHHHIEMIVSQYDEEDKQARVYGKFQHLIGLVFKKFDRNIHVIKPFSINKEDFVSVHALDTHPRIADKGLWVAIDKNGTKYITNELSVDGTTSEVAARVKEISLSHRVISNLLEPGAFIPDHHNDISLADRLSDNGVSYVQASKTRTMADRRIRDAFDYEQMETPEGTIHVTKPPELYIFDNCHELINELEHYRWQEYRGVTKDSRGPKQKPIDKDDHMIECLGRVLMLEPRWVPNQADDVSHYKPKNLDPY